MDNRNDIHFFSLTYLELGTLIVYNLQSFISFAFPTLQLFNLIISIKNFLILQNFEIMRGKIRKSCNTPNNSYARQKFLTGLKNNQILSSVQLLGKGNRYHQIYYQQPIQPLPSQSNITCKEDYSREELIKAFDKIAEGKKYIMTEDLNQFLMDENQEEFKKYQMIRMLDRDGKGYVTLQQFLQFYEQDIVANEDDQRLPNQFVGRQQWKQAVDINYELLEKLKDKQYCSYLVRELKKLRDINVNINSCSTK